MKNFLRHFLTAVLFFAFSAGSFSQISFMADFVDDCAPVTVYFYNMTGPSDTIGLQGNAKWEWNLNGTIFNTHEPPPQVYDAGWYHFHLYLYDDYDMSLVGEFWIDLEFKSRISDFNVVPGLQVCPGEPVQMSTMDPNWWFLEWDFGDGSFPTDANYYDGPIHTYTEPGIYDITLIAENQCGVDTVVKPIMVSAGAVPNVKGYVEFGNVVCPNDPVKFGVEGEFKSYLWNFGDGTTSTKKAPVHYYPAQTATDYTVLVTATNICGNSNTDTLTVSFVTDMPTEAHFDWWTEGSYSMYPCPHSRVYFNAHTSGTYFWDFGDGGFSEEPNPVNVFQDVGIYYVTLTVTNGCGNQAAYTDSIMVTFGEGEIPYADFEYEVEDMSQDQQDRMDTLRICPGETVKFWNYSYVYSGETMTYLWIFGDGTTSSVMNPSHSFINSGLYEVRLIASTACGGSNTMWKYVLVDPGLKPQDNLLGVVPSVICSGEKVFFFDNYGRWDRGKYTYDIDFGDGTVWNDITTVDDSVLMTIASYPYTGANGATFDYIFSITNDCGNSVSTTGTITITDDPADKPFYYVSNQTETDENKPPADWSVRKDISDHELTIYLNWSYWYSGLNENFFVYFWYGGFDPMADDPGPAHGFVQFTSDHMNYGDTVVAYIPLDPLQPPYVGMVAGWSCSGIVEQGIKPEVIGLLLDYSYMPVIGINIMPQGVSSTSDYGLPIQINADWDGRCLDQKPEGMYSYQLSPGNWVVLDMWDSGDGLYYDLYGSNDQFGESYLTTLSSGWYELWPNDTIVFYDEWNCWSMDVYEFVIDGDQLTLTGMDFYCQNLTDYAHDQTFTRLPDYGYQEDVSACPGDPVQFSIAGGETYEWHFGDGGSSNLQHPIHSYAGTGTYDAYVIATNACGRIDTFYTRVTVTDSNIPSAYFDMDRYDVPRYEPVQFYAYYYQYDFTKFYTYEWNFGDGSTSMAKNPQHIYERNGEYNVTLTVTNGCGSGTETMKIFVRDAELGCEAKFDVTKEGRTATFLDRSWGQPTSWFWNFGDGTTSKEQNPSHTYNKDGVYYVCLTIHDASSDCLTEFCREVVIGTLNCKADFRIISNEATNTVFFTDLSTNAVEWFWDFGDGSYSSEQNPIHQYVDPGFYWVYLAIFNPGNNCFSEIMKEVQVGTIDTSMCFADFSFIVDETLRSVVFTDLSSDNVTDWYWTFSDGTYDIGRKPVHIFPRTGVYDVCLIVFDDKTGCAAEICKKVPVGTATCNIQADFSYFLDMDNNSVSFNDKSTGNISKWFWDFGDGGTASRPNPTHTFDPGFYLVTLSVFSQDLNCADHVAEFIQVGTVDCRSNFEYTVNTTDNSVIFRDKSKGNIAEYFWYFGDGGYSVEKDPTHKYRAPGLYFAELTVVNEGATCMDFYIEPIQVGQVNCRASFDFFIDSATNVAYFSPDAVGEVTDYLWFFGDGSMSTDPNPVHVFTQPGYFTVGLNTYDATNNCMDYYEETILIGRAGIDCRANFMYMVDPETFEVSFTDKSKGNIVRYIWDYGDGEVDYDLRNPVHPYPDGGYYFVCLTVINSFGIPNTLCKFIQVAPDVSRDCYANFIFTVDSTNKSVRFIDKSLGEPDGWFWDFGDGETSTEQNPTHPYTDEDFYLVMLNTTNSTTNCTSEHFELINVSMGNQGLQTRYAYDIGDPIPLKADSYPVDFIGVSLGDGNKLKWDFGDGKVDSTSLNPTHRYDAPGEYTVCLTISNPVTGDSDTDCQTIVVGGTGMEDLEGLRSSISNFPNPFRGLTNITYMLVNEGEIDLSLFDNAGRKIATLVKDYREAGRYTIEFNGTGLDSGVYHLRLITNDDVLTKMMIVR